VVAFWGVKVAGTGETRVGRLVGLFDRKWGESRE